MRLLGWSLRDGKIMNDLDHMFEDLKNKFVDINGYQVFIKGASKVTFAHYIEQKELAENATFDDYAGGNSLIFRDIENDQHHFSGKQSYSFNDLIHSVTWHNNKQYQCLLVEAYEAFEDYVDELYEYIKQNEEGFFDNVSKKDPLKVLKKISTKISVISFLEKNNQQDCNYLFRTILISKLRHIIVHDGGFVKNIDELLEKTIGEMGLSGNRGDGKKYKDEMKFYLGEKDSKIFVLLLEHTQNNELPFNTYHDRLQYLVKDMLAYAKLLHDFIGRYFSDEDNIKKLATDIEFYKEFMNKEVFNGR